MCTSTPVILHTLQREWVPETVILDTMFLYNAADLGKQ